MADAPRDVIAKEAIVHAPRSRVWRALTDQVEFGKWFGVEMLDPFAPGRWARGRVLHPGYEHVTLEVYVERMEPERFIAWRGHPHALDPQADYSQEPMTLVEWTLDEVAEGTRVRVRESGFDQIPPSRRAEAFRMNDNGWTVQMQNLANHVG